MRKEELLGCWNLLSFEVPASGGVVQPFGDRPLGRLTYDATGHMAAQVMRSGKFDPTVLNIFKGTPVENQIARGYVAYFGTFEVLEAEGRIVHHIEGALSREYLVPPASNQTRFFEINGSRLIIHTKTNDQQNGAITSTLLWERLT